jgi:hypothetical protein
MLDAIEQVRACVILMWAEFVSIMPIHVASTYGYPKTDTCNFGLVGLEKLEPDVMLERVGYKNKKIIEYGLALFGSSTTNVSRILRLY